MSLPAYSQLQGERRDVSRLRQRLGEDHWRVPPSPFLGPQRFSRKWRSWDPLQVLKGTSRGFCLKSGKTICSSFPNWESKVQLPGTLGGLAWEVEPVSRDETGHGGPHPKVFGQLETAFGEAVRATCATGI